MSRASLELATVKRRLRGKDLAVNAIGIPRSSNAALAT